MIKETSKIGKRGTIVIPLSLRERFGIEEGTTIVAEEKADGILLRPVVSIPIEIYSPERKAEFLLSNAIDLEDYERASQLVREMGLNPEKIPHHKPKE